MICQKVTEQLGPFLDAELPEAVRGDVEAHLATCDSCRAELEAIRATTAQLASPPTAGVPETLWTAIEQRLVSEQRVQARTEPQHRRALLTRRTWLRRVPLALAAVFVVAVGLRILGPMWTGSSVHASTVDFSVLLNALPRDAREAFSKFLTHYDAKESSPAEARRFAPDLSFDVPKNLPGGFQRQNVYVLRFGDLAGVAVTYDRGGEFLGAVFHRPVNKEHFGPHRDYPCVVGKHEGHKVSVGEWKLVHLMDPTTCHCVLSRLDEQTELPDVMSAVAPGIRPGAGHHGH